MRSRGSLVWFGFALAGCPAKDTAGGDTGDSTSASGTGTGSGSLSSMASGTGGTGGVDAGSTGEPGPGPTEAPPARGVEVVAVTADQGVRVPIALDRANVSGSERNAPLVAGRTTLVRGFYRVEDGFVSREIAGKLILEHSDGTEREFTRVLTPSGRDCGDSSLIDCEYFSIPRSFWFLVPPEHVRPCTRYRLEVLEAAPGHEDDPSTTEPFFPADGSTLPLGVEDSYMKLRVVLVPFDHDLAGDTCYDPPELDGIYEGDQTVAELFGERLEANYPVDEVEIVAHEPVVYTGSMSNSDPLVALQELRAQEDAPPEYFYYGIARPCLGDRPSFDGLAFVGGPGLADAPYRVGWGVFHGDPGISAEVFVHEIGHAIGRRHIACSGDETGIDASYPDPDGDTLSWGTDVIGGSLRVSRPTAHDFMTYCSDQWVSEWGWNKVYPWVEQLSSYELQQTREPEWRVLLVGTIGADGQQSLFTTVGPWYEHGASDSLRVQTTAGALLSVPARIARLDHIEGVAVVAALPDRPERITALELSAGGTTYELQPRAIRQAFELLDR